jgi:two-component system, OmpR family, sensor histidine kinase SenX3
MAGVIFALAVGLAVGAVVATVAWRSAARRAAAREGRDLHAAGMKVQALEAALAELHAALDALPEGVVLVDADGRVLAKNRHAERFLGVAHLDALVDEAVETHLRDALAGAAGADTLEVYGPPRKTLVVRGSIVTVDGRRVGALATIEDVSERARLDSVRTDLVANISHELKTPVGAIALLAETLADEDEPEVVARLGPKLIAEAHRLSRIIDELLELSRIELGAQSLAEVVPMAAVVEEAVALQRSLADDRGITVRVDVPASAPSVVGNRRQLLSAVGNLVENAVKYSDSGSEVEVRLTAADGVVELAVQDHGIGIPARDLDRIFERFYRVDKARSRETGGTGLGLSIVRHVMANHGGEVTVVSSEGEGSTFTLRIRLARAGGSTEQDPSEVARAG